MCNSCEVLNINGVNCHESGCPDAWKDSKQECNWCGAVFKPEVKGQKCCSEDCNAAYNGYETEANMAERLAADELEQSRNDALLEDAYDRRCEDMRNEQ